MSGNHPKRTVDAAACLGVRNRPIADIEAPTYAPLMLGKLRDKLRDWNSSPLARWRVRFEEGHIVTSDGSEAKHRLPIRDLRRVVVQTDNSGPWGADVLYFLFADAPDPAGVFPIEAQGCQEFVGWLSTMPGYRDRELARAMASTDVASFIVYEAVG